MEEFTKVNKKIPPVWMSYFSVAEIKYIDQQQLMEEFI